MDGPYGFYPINIFLTTIKPKCDYTASLGRGIVTLKGWVFWENGMKQKVLYWSQKSVMKIFVFNFGTPYTYIFHCTKVDEKAHSFIRKWKKGKKSDPRECSRRAVIVCVRLSRQLRCSESCLSSSTGAGYRIISFSIKTHLKIGCSDRCEQSHVQAYALGL